MQRTEERSFQNVIRRLSNLLAMRSSVSFLSREQELKAFWMPDSISKECYDCSDKFTTFRRRHHCRICGHIFCSKCCSLEISGNFMGYSGNLRVCTYCYKVGQSYLGSSEMPSLSAKYLNESSTSLSAVDSIDERFISDNKSEEYTGFQEERYVWESFHIESSSGEKLQKWADTINLSSLIHQLFNPILGGLVLQNNRFKLKNFPQTFVGTELVDWLLHHKTIEFRTQGIIIGDMLLRKQLIKCLSHSEETFLDDLVIYQPTRECTDLLLRDEQPNTESEPHWVSLIELDENISMEDDAQNSSNYSNSNGASSNMDYTVKVDLSQNAVSMSALQPSGIQLKSPMPFAQKNHQDKEKDSSVCEPVEDFLCPTGLNTTLEHIHKATESDGSYDKMQEVLAFSQLERSFLQHYENLAKQLLTEEGLGFVWLDTVKELAVRVVESVHCDIRGRNDCMDMRCYIKVKKVPGGNKSQCQIVNGLVSTKHVARKQMRQSINNPKVMLLSSSIMYGRCEGKFLGLETLILQEPEYLRNMVNKVVSFKPDILVVERTVSRLAEDFLCEAGVTLVKNMKLTAMEKVARFTQAEVVPSIDSLVTPPVLGNCAKFYLLTYHLRPKVTKTLMFFDGCPQDLGCTIILRGASYSELARVKRVLLSLIFVCSNWVCESAFLCNECAYFPMLGEPLDDFDDFLLGKSKCHTFPSDKEGSPINSQEEESSFNTSNCEEKLDESCDSGTVKMGKCSSDVSLDNSVRTSSTVTGSDVLLSSEDSLQASQSIEQGTSSVSSEDSVVKCKPVDDRSDPLHLYLNSTNEDVILPCKESVVSVSLVPSTRKKFINYLDDIILSISPHVKFPPPYLETEKGKKVQLRQFLPQHMFWSKHFHKSDDANKQAFTCTYSNGNIDRSCSYTYENVKVHDPHPFTRFKITVTTNSSDFQSALADFRAQGGTLEYIYSKQRTSPFKASSPKKTSQIEMGHRIDALCLYNHQKIAILYCSYSYGSENFPGFCVGPWVVNMDFYGRDDITLGRFLEKYCFDRKYVCPSEVCRTSMADHIRKFAHDKYCLQVTIKQLDEAIPGAQSSIIMWSWCQKCRKISSVLPMREKTWSFSFAKYLELNFYGSGYQLGKQSGCDHSLHHDSYHYFGFRDVVASFKVFYIDLWEISLPSMAILIGSSGISSQQLIEDIKGLTVMGFGIFSSIFEKLSSLKEEAAACGYSTEHFTQITDHLQEDKNCFIDRLEKIQMKLTDPAFKDCVSDTAEKADHIYSVSDLTVALQSFVMSRLNSWNSVLTDLSNNKKRDNPEGNWKIGDNGNSKKKEDKLTVKSKSKQCGDSTLGDRLDVPRDCKNGNSSDSSFSVLDELSIESGATDPSQSMSYASFSLKHEECIKSLVLLDELAERQMEAVKAETEEGCNVSASTVSDSSLEVSGTVPVLSSLGMKLQSESYTVCHLREAMDTSAPMLPSSPMKKTDKGLGTGEESEERRPSSSNVKNLMYNLTSMFVGLPIKSPFPPFEHILLPPHLGPPVIVKENQISSVIAFTLSSVDYHRKLAEVKHLLLTSSSLQSEQASKSELTASTEVSGNSSDSITSLKLSVFSFLKSSPAEDDPHGPTTDPGDNTGPAAHPPSPLPPLKQPDVHIEIQFCDTHTKFYCRVYFAEQFRQLRKHIFPQGEERFLRSLSLSSPWAARGGKSGSEFSKTSDDRFVIKQMSKFEIQSFRHFAPNYFSYMEDILKNCRPTVLAKILGIYRISYRNSQTNRETKQDVLVMENLFYSRNITRKFDLKGSLRNRMVTHLGKPEHELVLMDENFLKTICDNPLYIRPHSKLVLTSAIQSDTLFLSSQSVMDYSLLVGLDTSKNELVLGIIDYIRTYTWEKRLESVVKSSGILGGQGKLPTIVSPELYRTRFCEAMAKYFLDVPDKWHGMGKG